MEIDFKDPKYYTNRELSWVLFDYRVLNEARDKSIPLFERLKFLSITASNLDEFFMIRVASLKDMENAGYTKKDIAGMTPTEQLKALMWRSMNWWICNSPPITVLCSRFWRKTGCILSESMSS